MTESFFETMSIFYVFIKSMKKPPGKYLFIPEIFTNR